MTLLASLLTSDQAVTRTRVLVGEDDDAARRDGKPLVAQSECSYYCPDAATAERCIASLRDSDERLRDRPDELMLWDWKSSYWEPPPVRVAKLRGRAPRGTGGQAGEPADRGRVAVGVLLIVVPCRGLW